tara:strand:+ start:334 stop:444 length:111 start_codon:yes stop_codon:yes gene_type:complete
MEAVGFLFFEEIGSCHTFKKNDFILKISAVDPAIIV